ncbi:hypothetical protein IL38_16070 [Actinopolyspora erythraea]|uniref:DUF397 domain-containing protein n=1 Tax=Actinopolyspora erythraea TaxID=414996 RepID=A0ABR4X1X3_9ACTN|nr:hypothetical protein IL38_16070 [Actinopolyspora erythraea]
MFRDRMRTRRRIHRCSFQAETALVWPVIVFSADADSTRSGRRQQAPKNAMFRSEERAKKLV